MHFLIKKRIFFKISTLIFWDSVNLFMIIPECSRNPLIFKVINFDFSLI